MKTIDELKEERRLRYRELCELSQQYMEMLPKFEDLRKRYEAAKEAYKNADYELALIDGRLQRVEERQRKAPTKPELSEEQLLAIAKALGIELNER